MFKISKLAVILTGLFLCVSCHKAISNEPNQPCQAKAAAVEQKQQNPYENSRILVEAFLVEVKLDALYNSGVSPLGGKGKSAAAENITAILKNKDNGKVVTGAKVFISNGERGRSNEEKSIQVPQEHKIIIPNQTEPQITRNFLGFKVVTNFSADGTIEQDGKIKVNFSFDQSTFKKNQKETETSFDVISRIFQSNAIFETGKPTIVGETQDEDSAIFLIITATAEK